jgi:hypothetical protein
MENPDITELKVDYSSSTRGGRDTTTEWAVKGLSIGKGGHGLYVSGKANAGDTVWLVYAVYSTGDSETFRRDGAIEFVSVHRDEQVARKNAQALADLDEDAMWGTKIPLALDTGEEIQYLVPWCGYFEHLSYVQCEPFVIAPSNVVSNTYLPRSLRRWD